jgi:hypothetical protein
LRVGGNWAMAGWVDRARVSKGGSTETKAFDGDRGLCQIDDGLCYPFKMLAHANHRFDLISPAL